MRVKFDILTDFYRIKVKLLYFKVLFNFLAKIFDNKLFFTIFAK